MNLIPCGLIVCCLVEFALSISEEHKQYFLKAHNDLRREIALGKTPNQPAAANMVEMVIYKNI